MANRRPAAKRSSVRANRQKNLDAKFAAVRAAAAVSEPVLVTAKMRERVAFHEAGHAAIAMACGVSVATVVIPRLGERVQAGDGAFAEYRLPLQARMWSSVVVARHIKTFFKILIGGAAAEIHRFGSASMLAADDIVRARETMKLVGAALGEALPSVQQMLDETMQDVAFHWKTIEALAAALLTDSKLSRRGARAIAQSCSRSQPVSRRRLVTKTRGSTGRQR